MFPDVLWFSRIPYAIVFLAASSFVTEHPVLAATSFTAEALSSTISTPLIRYAPPSLNLIMLSPLSIYHYGFPLNIRYSYPHYITYTNIKDKV